MEDSIDFREHSVNFREHSVNLREHSVDFKEHSAKLREHSVNFWEHSVVDWRVLAPTILPPSFLIFFPCGRTVLGCVNSLCVTARILVLRPTFQERSFACHTGVHILPLGNLGFTCHPNGSSPCHFQGLCGFYLPYGFILLLSENAEAITARKTLKCSHQN
jgi:hypothetical protein